MQRGNGFKVERVWMILEGPENDEGLAAAMLEGVPIPLYAAKEENVPRLVSLARQAMEAGESRGPYRLVEFHRAVASEIDPPGEKS